MVFGFGGETVDVVQNRHDVAAMEPVVEHVMTQLRGEGLPKQPVLVRALGDSNLSALDQGLIDALDRDGVPVRVDPPYGFHFGQQRVATRGEVSEIWYDTEQGQFKSLLSADPNARMVASWTPLSRSEEREMIRLQRSVAAQLAQVGRSDFVDKLDSPLVGWVFAGDPIAGVDQHQIDRIGELNAKVAQSNRCRCAVFAYPAATAPELPYTHG